MCNAGADLGATAAAINLVAPAPTALLVVAVAAVLLGFLIFGRYPLIESVFKWLTLALFAYVASAVLARPAIGEVMSGALIPRIVPTAAGLTLLVAALGGNISPYLFFWQPDLAVEEARTQRRRWRLRPALHRLAWDTLVGMAFSNAVIFFIEAAAAATLFKCSAKRPPGSGRRA